MKRTLLTLTATILFSFQASAATPHSWFCTADGYDHDNRLRSISGRLMPTQKQAEQSALQTCRGFYMACSVRSCFQEQ